jgi:hypothetical protein
MKSKATKKTKQTVGNDGELSGSDMIMLERSRQIVQERWTPGHDDTFDQGELACAGASYAMAASVQSSHNAQLAQLAKPPRQWPYENKWWKPTADPIRNLVKAGALIAAEIDRLQRSKARKNKG